MDTASLMKWLISGLLFLCCTGAGFLFSGGLKKRIAFLQSSLEALDHLHTQRVYGADPLRQALMDTAQRVPEPYATLYASAQQHLGAHLDAVQAFSKAFAAQKGEGNLFAFMTEADEQAFMQWAMRLGSERQGQQAAFSMMTTYLKQSLRAAEAEYARLGRLYQSSGLLVGALLVVLFL